MISGKIDAAVVYLAAPRQLEIRTETLDPAALHARDVLCATVVSAISPGTELAAYSGLPQLRLGVGYPRLQGYCNVSRVLAVGAAVAGFRAGDRVLSFAAHRSHFVLPADDVLMTLDESMSAEDTACTYLFHLGYNTVLRADVRAGSRVLVIGLGALGLTTVAAAALAGARVYGISNYDIPKRIALEFGAEEVFHRADLRSARAALTAGLADVVAVTTDSWDDWAIALESAGHLGRIACLGFPGRSAAPGAFNPLDSRFFYTKQLRIEAVGHSPERPDARGFARFNERDNLRFIAELIAKGRLQARRLVSATYAGRDIAAAYRHLLERKDSPITCLLRWQ